MSMTKELTNALLKEKMVDTVCTRNYPSDLDTVTKPGVYQVGDSTISGRPGNVYGTMEVIASNSFVIQIIYGQYGEQIQRMKNGSKPWGPWYKTTLTLMT